jgi:WhiB family transcriptional regulator, redox-sensing transcriptional regulator
VLTQRPYDVTQPDRAWCPGTAAKPHTLTTAPCLHDPDRWLDGGDDPELKALCRACPRRWLCAKEALETPGAQGMWSGVNIPEYGRGRTFAMRQLRSLAAYGGQGLRK